VRAHFFGGHEVHGKTGASAEGHEVANAELLWRARSAQTMRTEPLTARSKPNQKARGRGGEEQPGEQSNDDGRAVAEDGGVGGSGAQDGSVVEGEIEGEE